MTGMTCTTFSFFMGWKLVQNPFSKLFLVTALPWAVHIAMQAIETVATSRPASDTHCHGQFLFFCIILPNIEKGRDTFFKIANA